jgi:hypothetical protein
VPLAVPVHWIGVESVPLAVPVHWIAVESVPLALPVHWIAVERAACQSTTESGYGISSSLVIFTN